MDLAPLISAVSYYAVVLVVAELARKVLDRTTGKGSQLHRFFIEFIGTVQVLTCIFENGVIVVHYGVPAFFVVTGLLGFLFGKLNREAIGTPLVLLENFIFHKESLWKTFYLLVAQLLAGFYAFTAARYLWYYSLTYSQAHYDFFVNTSQRCSLNHKLDLALALVFETLGCFFLRFISQRIPKAYFQYLFPAFLAAVFSSTILFIGDSALDPLVAAILFYGCEGLNFQWFMLLYWICPTIGWLANAYLDVPKKVSKKVKKN